ncbi:universal stress protein [Haladaptatus halobius]|uniref:universal stress protein n=1 Tax=Haladaptatus halobius TaxID=2884875 RepID=UPI001D0AE18E|nr:universal stress protein [Haladaptatus halobius]
MQPSLVVVNDTDAHERLLREAGRIAAATDTPLVLLSWMSEEEVERNTETLQAMSDTVDMSFDIDTAQAVATQFAREAADDAFADADGTVEYDVVSVVSEDKNLADEVLRVAQERGCDHVYIVGRQRSPTGKAVFGDTAQRVILNFDGPVTILTE